MTAADPDDDRRYWLTSPIPIDPPALWTMVVPALPGEERTLNPPPLGTMPPLDPISMLPPGVRTARPSEEARVDPPRAAVTDAERVLPGESRLFSNAEAIEEDVGDAPDAHDASFSVVGDTNGDRLAPPLPLPPLLRVPPVEGVLVALLVRSLLGDRT